MRRCGRRRWRMVDEAVQLDAEELHARWILAELDRMAGRLDEADGGYRWLIRYYNEHDVVATPSRSGGSAWRRPNPPVGIGSPISSIFSYTSCIPTRVERNRDYWPAHYEAGMLFLEKHNTADAAKEFQAALEINPNAAEVHAAIGRSALEQRRVEKAESSLTRALEINPRLARCLAAEGRSVVGQFPGRRDTGDFAKAGVAVESDFRGDARPRGGVLSIVGSAGEIGRKNAARTADRRGDAAESRAPANSISPWRRRWRIAASFRRPRRISASRSARCRRWSGRGASRHDLYASRPRRQRASRAPARRLSTPIRSTCA